LNEDEAETLKNIVYDKTAMEMAKSTMYDLLIKRYGVRNKKQSEELDMSGSKDVFQRYNQIINYSSSMLNYANEAIKVTDLEEFAYLGYSKEKISSISMFIKKLEQEINGLNNEFKSLIRDFKSNIRSGKLADIEVKTLSSSIDLLNNKIVILINKIDSFVSSNNIMWFMLEKERAGSRYSKYISGSHRLIFDIIKKILSEVFSSINMFSFNTTGTTDLKKSGSKSGAYYQSVSSGETSRFSKQKQETVSVPYGMEFFEARIESGTDDLSIIFEMSDNIDTSFRALGIKGDFVNEMKREISNSVFGRAGLDLRVEKFISQTINSKIDKVINGNN